MVARRKNKKPERALSCANSVSRRRKAEAPQVNTAVSIAGSEMALVMVPCRALSMGTRTPTTMADAASRSYSKGAKPACTLKEAKEPV